MHISRLDLNLLVVFESVYAQGSISRAADVLHLSQPAVSHALRRLRQAYDDELFVRQGRQMFPTPRARQIRPVVQQALGAVQTTLRPESRFDAAHANHSFTLGMRDLVEALVVPDLAACFQQHAPQVRWSTRQVPRREMELELGAGRLDLAFDVLLPLGPRVRQCRLLADQYVVLARKQHPQLRRGLSLSRYLSAQHIAVSSRSSGPAIEDFELSRLGHQRDVVMRCQHFFVARQTVAQTDLLLTLPRRYAAQAGFAQGLRIHPMPIDLPPLAVHLYWHESQEDDPANRWLREQVVAIAGQLEC